MEFVAIVAVFFIAEFFFAFVAGSVGNDLAMLFVLLAVGVWCLLLFYVGNAYFVAGVVITCIACFCGRSWRKSVRGMSIG